MALTSSPYLSFPGNASEAFPYYQELFGGELDMQTYDAMPSLEGFPFTPPPGAVAHATLTAPGIINGRRHGRRPALTVQLRLLFLPSSTRRRGCGFIDTVISGGGAAGCRSAGTGGGPVRTGH